MHAYTHYGRREPKLKFEPPIEGSSCADEAYDSADTLNASVEDSGVESVSALTASVSTHTEVSVCVTEHALAAPR